MKRAVVLGMVVVLIALATGPALGARPSKTSKRQETTIQKSNSGRPFSRNGRMGSKVSASGASRPNTSKHTPCELLDEDQWVADCMAQSGSGKMSKYGWFRSDLVDKVEARLKRSLNYDTLPARYRKLIDANRSNYFFMGADEKDPYYVFESDDFSLREADGRTIVWHHKLDATKMMAIFEPVHGGKPFFSVPEPILKTFSEEDQLYTRQLTEVVNEVVSFLFDVPFFVPDMARLDRGDYAGKFIPEKYLIKGKRLQKLPEGLVAPEKAPFYERWGWPVYDLAQVETGEIRDVSGCFVYSEYQKRKVVDQLVVINLDMTMEKGLASLAGDSPKEWAIDLIRIYQYKRGLKDLEILKQALAAEREALQAEGKLTPARARVLTNLEKQLGALIPQGEKVLQKALDEKQFIFSLRQPKGEPIRPKRISVLKPEYTSGRQPE